MSKAPSVRTQADHAVVRAATYEEVVKILRGAPIDQALDLIFGRTVKAKNQAIALARELHTLRTRRRKGVADG